MPPDPARVRSVKAELDRGLQPTRPAFLKWICDKLDAMPTQDGSGRTAAIWADNVIDTCGHYPEDLLQGACLELLRTKTFRPQPAEIVAVIEPRYAERQRMRDRCKLMLPATTKAEPDTFVREPQDVRLRTIRDSWLKVGNTFRAAISERELAKLENREPEDWAKTTAAPEVVQAPVEKPMRPSFVAQQQATRDRLAELAAAHRAGVKPPPPKVDADDYGHLASG